MNKLKKIVAKAMNKRASEWKLGKLIAEDIEQEKKLHGSIPITNYAVYWNIQVFNDMKELDVPQLSKKAQDAIFDDIEVALQGGFSKGEIQLQKEDLEEEDIKILNEDLLLEFFLNFEEKDLDLDDVEIDLGNTYEELPESYVKFRQLASKKKQVSKMASIISKEILKSAKVSKKARVNFSEIEHLPPTDNTIIDWLVDVYEIDKDKVIELAKNSKNSSELYMKVFEEEKKQKKEHGKTLAEQLEKDFTNSQSWMNFKEKLSENVENGKLEGTIDNYKYRVRYNLSCDGDLNTATPKIKKELLETMGALILGLFNRGYFMLPSGDISNAMTITIATDDGFSRKDLLSICSEDILEKDGRVVYAYVDVSIDLKLERIDNNKISSKTNKLANIIRKEINKSAKVNRKAINNYTRPPEGEDAIEFDIYYDNGRSQWDFDDNIKRIGDKYVYVDFGNYNAEDVLQDNITITTTGYSQGDWAKVYIPKELENNPRIQSTIDHLFWDSPVYGIIKINDEEIYVDELLSNVYEWNKEEVLSKLKSQVSEKTYEYLKNNLPTNLEYRD